MPGKWTTCTPELLIPLTRGMGRPLKAQVEDRLRNLIRSGVLAPGRRAALVLGYAAMREAAIRAGIAELARVL
jgi:hypothetical protein